MTLPSISIPTIPLPVDVSPLWHPSLVHFVVAIPLVIILLEIINLFFNKRALSLFSLFLISLVALFMVASYFTGVVDAKETYPLLSPEGQVALKEHKLLGAYLVYGALAMVLLKLLFMAFAKVVGRIFFILIFLGFSAGILIQGKEGGKLVYTHGANNKVVSKLLEAKEELQEDLNDLQDEYDALKEQQATQVKAQESTSPTPSVNVESSTTATKSTAQQEDSSTTIRAPKPTTVEPEAKTPKSQPQEESKEESKSPTSSTVTTPKEEEVTNKNNTATSQSSSTIKASPVSLEIPIDDKIGRH